MFRHARSVRLNKYKSEILLLAGLGIVLVFMEISGIGCPIKWFTGISCAGCGMTRAVLCALRLQFDRALYYHPLFWLLPFLILLYLLWGRIPRKIRRGLTGTVILCFMGVYLIRLCDSGNSVVTADLQESLPVRLWLKLFTG